ncbi:MAG TPA: hypothetical protein VH500_09355 [Nitrososphaeraceae archaeon]
MAGANNFAVERSKSDRCVDWMNSYSKKHNKKFEALLSGRYLITKNFGEFEMISWKGDWSFARQVFVRTSSKVGARVIEAGYHKKGNLFQAFFGINQEFAKVYSNGTFIGNVVLETKAGNWIAKFEKLG